MTPTERDKLLLETQLKIGAKNPLITLEKGKIVSRLSEEQRREISRSFEEEGQIKAAEYFRQGIQKDEK